ncbi:MAG: DEAD/DEAH box helicase family protein, partial [Abditibacteriota bacterium]|nr:DEAD/DEAH box helicase family protein [Abditibacteriota bacterium]
RILIADSVGVGKTIEAGLIIKELEARSDLEKVLIICPKPLVAERKWELEMKRFEENDFVTLDKPQLRLAIEDCHLDEIWPRKYNKAIIPYSVLDSETYNSLAEKEWYPGHKGLDPAPHFDLVIIDEAHHIRKGTMMKDKAFQYKCIHYLCEHASAVVMLTATPLQTDDDDLFTLLNLLRPDLILDKDVFNMMMRPNKYIFNCSGAIRSGSQDWAQTAIDELKKVKTTDWGENVIAKNPLYEDILSRLANCLTLTDKDRERQERVSLAYDVESLHTLNNMLNRTRRKDIEMSFCTRRSYTVSVKFTERQREMHDALLNFEEYALKSIHDNRGVRFMMSTIRRQASSCIFALAPYVADLVERRMDRIDPDFDDDEQEIREVVFSDEQIMAMLAQKLLTLSKDLPEEDPKFEKIIEIIEEKQKQENNKIILFSTFRHTLEYLEKKLKNRGYRAAQVHGGTKDEERQHLTNRFRMDKRDPDALDILLFTEVGAEGLDYQFCDTMINYDLPWNPMKIEQRIGRIDRRGQKSEVVHIYNIITEDTVDAEIYDRCLQRIGIFERSIGECEAILADMSKELNTIASGGLTDEERQRKLQQLADNEVRLIQEEAQREEDEKSLFGFSFAGAAHAKDLNDAESLWVSPEAIRRLIVRYFADRLGDKEVFSGKQMHLGKDSKRALLEDYRKLPKNSSSVYAAWEAYLKDYSADKQWHQVAFKPEDADTEPKPFFFTPTHPLVKQAARHFADSSESFVRLACISDTLPAGSYPFS